jgi:hypothetical protein
MPKRRPVSATEPLDIFENPRLSSAMAAATSPEPVPRAPSQARLQVPEEVEPAPATSLRSVPRAPESTPTEPPEAPSSASEPAPKPVETGPAKGRKGRAEVAEEPEPEELPEPNVPLKFRVPQTLRSEFQTFKAELSAALGGVVLDDSNLGRPLLEHFLVDQRDRIIETAATFKGKLRRPANGDAVGMAEFDHTLGEIFSEARKRRRSAPSAGDA